MATTTSRGGRTARSWRPGSGLIVAGVASRLAGDIGVPVWLVRAAFVGLAVTGIGVILYAALVVAAPNPGYDAAGVAGLFRATAVAIVAAGALLVVRAIGLWPDDGLMWSLLVVAIGVAVIWQRVEARQPGRWRRLTSRADVGPIGDALGGRAAAIRLVAGGALVIAGVAGLLVAVDALAAAREGAVAMLAAAAGVTLILGPWLVRLGRAYSEERSGRIRAQEREEMAAQIHDSTLQTLALIQRSAGDGAETARLARRGERELRGWLFPDAAGRSGGLREAMQTTSVDVEGLFDVSIEVVSVGDAPMSEPLAALVAASREALVNAAKFSGQSGLSLFFEVEGGRAKAYVRDGGGGFDPESVSDDRRGIRDSIVGRLERHGGSGKVTSEPGGGTEVEMEVPRRP